MDFSVCRPQSAEHSIIHRQPDRFASWVFNGGLWQFVGDEIVIGFGSFKCAYDGPESVKHASFEHGESSWQLARSTDGGRTWEQRDFVERSDSVAAEKLSPYSDPGEPVSFTDSDLLLCHRDDLVILSPDRGRTFTSWRRVPHCRHKDVRGRSDWAVRPDGACLLFSTVSTEATEFGRPVVYISRNGGQSWEFLNYMTPEPQNRWLCYPSGLWLASGRCIAAVRSQMLGHGFSFWTEIHASDDGGRNWSYLSRVNDLGAPCQLRQLRDGRILATYGYRSRPFGVRAAVSEDGGMTWGPEIIIRDDGKSWDLGYPRSAELEDGTIFSAYYFNASDDPVDVDGGVRHIAGTHWTLP